MKFTDLNFVSGLLLIGVALIASSLGSHVTGAVYFPIGILFVIVGTLFRVIDDVYRCMNELHGDIQDLKNERQP